MGVRSTAVKTLALAAAALVLAAPAAAAPGDKAGMTVARATWGQPPCGTPSLEVSTPTAYQAAHGTGYFGEITPLSWADTDRCAIVINPDLAHLAIRTPVKRCDVIVHEWGHLTGHAHSTNPRSVMYGDADVVSENRERTGRRWHWVTAGAFKPCYAAVRAVQRTQLKHAY